MARTRGGGFIVAQETQTCDQGKLEQWSWGTTTRISCAQGIEGDYLERGQEVSMAGTMIGGAVGLSLTNFSSDIYSLWPCMFVDRKTKFIKIITSINT
jgi:hypothetical protein